MNLPTLYYVEHEIPDIGAKAGDVIVDDPTDGISVLKRCPGKQYVVSTYQSRLRYLPRPSKADLEKEKPHRPNPFATAPPVEGWN